MFFVPTKHAGYVLFCLTPSSRAAVALTDDQQRVHLLARGPAGEWTLLREWPVTERSHTDILISLGGDTEPAEPTDLIVLIERQAARAG